MPNKKSMGLHWDILLLALFISIGILYYSIGSTKIPKAGEYSLEIIKTAEENGFVPSIMEIFMKMLNSQTAGKFGDHELFKVRSYCESAAYKASLTDKTFIDSNKKLSKVHDTISCLINGNINLTSFYAEKFDENYNRFRSEEFRAIDIGTIYLDISNTAYTSNVVRKEGAFFNIINTTNGFWMPINTEEGIKKTQIGKITMKPAYRLQVNYNFDDPSKEVCIFSRDCGATCQDVIDKYSAKGYEIKEKPCSKYYDCAEGEDAKDDFGKYYCEGQGFLCQGQCLPFCSSSDPDAAVDSDPSTKCKETSCDSYMSCGAINPADKCWCSAGPYTGSYACEGSNCDVLHCDRDQDYNTYCREISCGEYHDCSSASLPCDCDSGLNECQGTCPSCWSGDWADQGCEGGKRKYTREVKPTGCTNDVAYDPYGCDAACDPCACNRGPYCGSCGHDACYSIGECVSGCSSCTDIWTCNAQRDENCLTQTCASLGCGNTDACGAYCGDCPPQETTGNCYDPSSGSCSSGVTRSWCESPPPWNWCGSSPCPC